MARARMALALVMAACTDPPAALFGSGPDGAPADASLNCSPIESSCADGSGCYWAGPGRFECAAALGLPRYHACRQSVDCSPGDGCHLDDTLDFFCVGYCDYRRFAGERDPRCGANEICAGPLDGGIGICLGLCDALDPDCPDGQGCYLREGADLCLPVIGEAAPGEPCSRNNDCAPGGGCRAADDTCALYCDHEANPDQADPRCGGRQVCGAIAPGERLGYCQ